MKNVLLPDTFFIIRFINGKVLPPRQMELLSLHDVVVAERTFEFFHQIKLFQKLSVKKILADYCVIVCGINTHCGCAIKINSFHHRCHCYKFYDSQYVFVFVCTMHACMFTRR